MSGTKLLLGTNALIAFLKGDNRLLPILLKRERISTSAICVIEFLSYSSMPEADVVLLNNFAQTIEVIGLSNDIASLTKIVSLKKQFNLKLPDAIIAAQAMKAGASLVSNDRHFKKLSHLSLITF